MVLPGVSRRSGGNEADLPGASIPAGAPLLAAKPGTSGRWC